MNIKIKPINKKDIEILLQYIPYFSENHKFAEWKGGEKDKNGIISLPYLVYSDEVTKFIKLLYKTSFIVQFNWSKWEEGKKIINDKNLIDQVDFLTLRMLMTLILRSERFIEGNLLGYIEDGTILRILKRLKFLFKNNKLD